MEGARVERTCRGTEGRGGEPGGCTRKMELLGDQWPAGIFTTALADSSFPLPLPPDAAMSPSFRATDDTYFSLACESEGTDDPFPFAYIVVVVVGHFFQRKHKRAAKLASCALDGRMKRRMSDPRRVCIRAFATLFLSLFLSLTHTVSLCP